MKIKKELSKKNDRQYTKFYVSKSIYQRFERDCDETPPSEILEMLMKLFSKSRRAQPADRAR